MEHAHGGILLWSGPAHRKIQRLDGHGGLRSFESAGAESEEAKENSVGQCSSAKLWVHFPQATKEATDAFKGHVTEFVLPAEDGCAASNKFVHAVRKSLNNAPPHYADFAFRTTTTMAEPTEQPKDDLNMKQQSAIHLSFQLYQSSQICRLFATPDICLTQISPCLNLEDVFDDLANGVGPGSTAEIILRVVEAVVEENKRSAGIMDDSLGRLEETVLGAMSVQNDVLSELSTLRRAAVHHRRALLLQLSVLDAFERDAAVQEPENQKEVVDRSDFLLAQLTDSEMARLAYAKEGMKLVLELLESARDRSAFVAQEVSAKNQQRTNRLLALLTGISGVLLPLQMAMYWIEGSNMGWLHL